MAKKFTIPDIYESSIIRNIKERFQILDPRKKDLTPSLLDLGPVHFLIPRHFGFCYGVQNAIDIAYGTIDEHKDKRIFFLSEMIHNPDVNADLHSKGVRFLFEPSGKPLIDFDNLTSDDIVVVPAFGTTIEIQAELKQRGIDPYSYDTTCPFVEKVWKRGDQIGEKGYSLVIHGKYQHEETRATFSHAAKVSPSVVVLNVNEARRLADYMLEILPFDSFYEEFRMKCTPGFNPVIDLERFGVVNQTTMLATETQEVMDILKEAASKKYGSDNISNHFADTSDTLCYATNENQSATLALRDKQADLALVVGGYNSSNTMHIVELLEERLPTYHIRNASEITSPTEINHFNQWKKMRITTSNWLSIDKKKEPVNIAITSGASCPDALVDEVILKIASWFPNSKPIEDAVAELTR